MDDYIKREDALDIVADNNVTGEITLNRYDKIIDGIYGIPSADVAPVVRCKDCVHYRVYQLASDGETITDCAVMPCHPPENWYCSNAERKDDE